jgi:hypothetical protein
MEQEHFAGLVDDLMLAAQIYAQNGGASKYFGEMDNLRTQVLDAYVFAQRAGPSQKEEGMENFSDDALFGAYHSGMAAYWNGHMGERDHHEALLCGLRAVASFGARHTTQITPQATPEALRGAIHIHAERMQAFGRMKTLVEDHQVSVGAVNIAQSEAFEAQQQLFRLLGIRDEEEG